MSENPLPTVSVEKFPNRFQAAAAARSKGLSDADMLLLAWYPDEFVAAAVAAHPDLTPESALVAACRPEPGPAKALLARADLSKISLAPAVRALCQHPSKEVLKGLLDRTDVAHVVQAALLGRAGWEGEDILQASPDSQPLHKIPTPARQSSSASKTPGCVAT